MSGRSQIQIELFAYPEFNKSRNQVEARTLDYSHILTNIRSHISQRDMNIIQENILWNFVKNNQIF